MNKNTTIATLPIEDILMLTIKELKNGSDLSDLVLEVEKNNKFRVVGRDIENILMDLNKLLDREIKIRKDLDVKCDYCEGGSNFNNTLRMLADYFFEPSSDEELSIEDDYEDEYYDEEFDLEVYDNCDLMNELVEKLKDEENKEKEEERLYEVARIELDNENFNLAVIREVYDSAKYYENNDAEMSEIAGRALGRMIRNSLDSNSALKNNYLTVTKDSYGNLTAIFFPLKIDKDIIKSVKYDYERKKFYLI